MTHQDLQGIDVMDPQADANRFGSGTRITSHKP